MRINIIEKFDLYERVEALSTSLSEHEESRTICKNAIHSMKSSYSDNLLKKFINEISEYKWIESVENFLSEFETFRADNTYGLRLESIMDRLKSTGSNTYQPIVSKLTTMVALDESQIKNKLHELSSFKFEPSIRNVISVFEKESFKKEETTTATIEAAPISAVMQIEEGFVFSVNNNNYMVGAGVDKISKYKGKTSGMYKAAQNALNYFKYQGKDKFSMRTPKANISVIASDGGNRIFINESEIHDKKALSNVLKTSGIIAYADVKTRSMIEFMYENAHSLVEIEFVKNVTTTNESFDVFKLANNEVVISKFDKLKRSTVLEALDIEDIEELSETLKTKHNIDFELVLEGLAINKDCLAFERLVENIVVADILDTTKVEDTFSKLEEALDTYSKFNVENRKNVEKAFESLEAKQSTLKLDKVAFLLETRNALEEKLADDQESLSESLTMVNDALTKLV